MTDPITASSRGEVLASISNGLVGLHRRYYGKGPTKAKTFLVDDTVMCMLKGGFTTVERTLIDDGKSDAVEEIRRSVQRTMEGQFTTVVEDAVGRTVIAYMSQVHSNPDMAVELFVLEAGDGDGDGRIVAAELEQELRDGDGDGHVVAAELEQGLTEEDEAAS